MWKLSKNREILIENSNFSFMAMTKPSLWTDRPRYLWSIPQTYQIPPVEKNGNFRFSTGLWRFYPHFPWGSRGRKLGNYRDFGRILMNSTNFHKASCVKLLFSTQFSTSCGKVYGKLTGSVWNRWKILGRKQSFPHGQERVAGQLPLISLTISSISVRKTGFCTMRFSMVSREERTVE